MSKKASFALRSDRPLLRCVQSPTFLLLLYAFIVFSPSFAYSLPPIGHLPPLIRITGVLLGPGEAVGMRYPTLDVTISGESRVLYVREVESLTSADRGWPILRNLGAFLTLTGPATLIARLNSEEAPGWPLLIEGRLYMRDRVLILTSVEFIGAQFQ